MTGSYNAMRTDELEALAAARGVSLDGATTNAQRARRLRDADAGQVARGFDVRDSVPPPVRPRDVSPALAPYPSDADLAARLAAASGSDDGITHQDPPGGGLRGPAV